MPVLSDASRETIYTDVYRDKMQLKVVSAKYGVDVRRVAAILRLKAVEKKMVESVSFFSSFSLLFFFFFFFFSSFFLSFPPYIYPPPYALI